MKKHLLLIALLVVFLAPVCMAQKNTASPATPPAVAPSIVSSEASVTVPRPHVDGSITKLIDTFFDLLAHNQIDKAYERLTLGTKIAEQEKDIATLRAKTQQAIQYLGEVRGHELVAVKNVGTHLLAATYLSLGKDFPLRWRFYFYRAEDTWKLIDIRVDDRLMDMFDDKPAQPQPASMPAVQ